MKLYRFALYLENLEDIERLNRLEQGSAVYGETQFTDMSKEEMKMYLGVRVPDLSSMKLNFI